MQALTAFRVIKTQSEKISPNHGDCGDKLEKVMEREVVSFKKFKEILGSVGLEDYETERFVDALIYAAEFYENTFIMHKEKVIRMHLEPNDTTIDCDIICKGARIEVTLKQPVLEKIKEAILKERLIERGYTPTEAEILWKLM